MKLLAICGDVFMGSGLRRGPSTCVGNGGVQDEGEETKWSEE